MYKGFTLLEMIVTLALLSMVAVFAISNFSCCYEHIQLNAIAVQITREMLLARSEAIANSQAVSYCTEQTGNWNGVRQIVTGKHQVLHAFQPLPSRYQLKLNNSLGQNDKIIYQPLGFTNSQLGSFYLSSSTETLRLVFHLAGEIDIRPLTSANTLRP